VILTPSKWTFSRGETTGCSYFLKRRGQGGDSASIFPWCRRTDGGLVRWSMAAWPEDAVALEEGHDLGGGEPGGPRRMLG
jgi:hypothetical protein